jgi:hypothetical protein
MARLGAQANTKKMDKVAAWRLGQFQEAAGQFSTLPKSLLS